MQNYHLQPTNKKYSHSANPPVLDKVVFTIDHIHMGNSRCCSTLETVRMLTNFGIPVTVFMECTDPRNRGAVDEKHAGAIFELNPDLVTLGIHSLSIKNSQFEQNKNLTIIREVIKSITGSTTRILSYHGKDAGPEAGISYDKVEFARGIKSNWSAAKRDNLLDTPVMAMNTLERGYEYTRQRNVAGLSSTVFIHTGELIKDSNKKAIFDTIVNEVRHRRLQAVPYYETMREDYYNLKKKAG